MHIVVLGHVCIDKNTSENSSYTAPGSPAMFLSKIFKQLPDCTISTITPYGEDFLSYASKVSLYPKQATTKHTLVYENITKNKHRTQKAYFFAEAQPVLLEAEERKILAKADVLYIAPILPNFSTAYVSSVVQTIPKTCLKILSPQGYFRTFDDQNNVLVREFSEASEVLSLIDVVIVSEQDHPDMKRVAKEWAERYKIVVIVTTGEKGAEIFTSQAMTPVSTDPVSEKNIVDSVGSGDIFSAGFGYLFQKTKDIISSVTFANKLARECLFYTSEKIIVNYDALTMK